MRQNKREIKEYQGLERGEQLFVKRLEFNPRFGRDGDNRRYRDTAIWRFCKARFRAYWNAQGEPNRAVPGSYRENGDEGWYFPAIWVAEFLSEPPREEPPSLWKQGIDSLRLDMGGGFPTPTEFRNWKLPVGAKVVAGEAMIEYPDGSRETWGAIRRRIEGRDGRDRDAA